MNWALKKLLKSQLHFNIFPVHGGLIISNTAILTHCIIWDCNLLMFTDRFLSACLGKEKRQYKFSFIFGSSIYLQEMRMTALGQVPVRLNLSPQLNVQTAVVRKCGPWGIWHGDALLILFRFFQASGVSFSCFNSVLVTRLYFILYYICATYEEISVECIIRSISMPSRSVNPWINSSISPSLGYTSGIASSGDIYLLQVTDEDWRPEDDKGP